MFSLKLSLTMASPIKLFQSLKQFYKTLDVYSPQQSNPYNTFNLKILCISILIINHFVSSIAYFLCLAESIQEFGDSLFAALSELLCLAYFTVIISKMHNIFELIDKYEEFIGKSTTNFLFTWRILYKNECFSTITSINS